MDKTSIDVPGATFTGNITIHGDMFNIHDNQHVHVNVNRQPQEADDEDYEYVDFVLKSPMVRSYYSSKASGTSKSMPKIKKNLQLN